MSSDSNPAPSKKGLSTGEYVFAAGMFLVGILASVGIFNNGETLIGILAILMVVFGFAAEYGELLAKKELELLSKNQFYIKMLLSLGLIAIAVLAMIFNQNETLALFAIAWATTNIAIAHSRRPASFRG
jgi:hypothetical protein